MPNHQLRDLSVFVAAPVGEEDGDVVYPGGSGVGSDEAVVIADVGDCAALSGKGKSVSIKGPVQVVRLTGIPTLHPGSAYSY